MEEISIMFISKRTSWNKTLFTNIHIILYELTTISCSQGFPLATKSLARLFPRSRYICIYVDIRHRDRLAYACAVEIEARHLRLNHILWLFSWKSNANLFVSFCFSAAFWRLLLCSACWPIQFKFASGQSQSRSRSLFNQLDSIAIGELKTKTWTLHAPS